VNFRAKQKPSEATAPFVTIDKMIRPGGIIYAFLSPVPSRRAVARWFKKASVPCLKLSPDAKRGGGVRYYDASEVLKFLSRMGNGIEVTK